MARVQAAIAIRPDVLRQISGSLDVARAGSVAAAKNAVLATKRANREVFRRMWGRHRVRQESDTTGSSLWRRKRFESRVLFARRHRLRDGLRDLAILAACPFVQARDDALAVRRL